MEWKVLIFLVCLSFTQVVSDCPDGCFCESFYVKCVRSYLKSVPSDLSSNVTILDLAVNEIKDLKRSSFLTTPDLEILLLNNNQINLISNGVFDNLSKLRFLHLQKNKISTIETQAFKNLENLQELFLHYNNIAKLDAGSFKTLVNLERLRLDGNPLNCNCEILMLVDSFRERKNVQISGTCSAPKSLQNELISNVKYEKFTECDALRIVEFPNNVEIPESGLPSVTLRCVVVGYPKPQISWEKNGQKILTNDKYEQVPNGLIIKSVTQADVGKYQCVASNIKTTVTSVAELKAVVKATSTADKQIPQNGTILTAERTVPKVQNVTLQNQDKRAPQIIQKPFNIDIPKFSDIRLSCKAEGNPQPRIQWFKNDKPLIIDDLRIRIQNDGELRINNVSSTDSGTYKCVATNTHGFESASGFLTVLLDLELDKIIDDTYIHQAVEKATARIERVINTTLELITSKAKNDQSPGFMRSLYRFPDEFTRNISKCREVFFITVNLTQVYVRNQLNLSADVDIRPERLFTPTQLNLIKKLSGCEASVRAANCSANMEFHSKYATLDGTCNNLQHPLWGASYTAFRRLLKPIYANRIDTPIGWNKELLYYGFPRPSPRLVSATLIRTYNITPDTEITHLVMQWGQFMDHDLDHAPPSATTESFNGVKCSDTCDYDEPCYPIRIPENDSRHPNKSCFEFIRSTSILPLNDEDNSNDLPYREQLNQPTCYIDGGMVYGFNEERAHQLRDMKPNLGLLRTGDKNYLPTARANLSEEVDCKLSTLVNDTRPNPGCYFAGDVRVNEMIGLLTMHTIWFREHNRLAKELRKINPHWDGDQIYYEARKILAAELQHITYQHWLKHIIGPEGMEKLGPYNGYDPNVHAAISNVFATAALRVGHTIINPNLVRLDHNYEVVPQGNLPLSKSFFAPWRLIQEGGVDPVVRGFYAIPAKRKYPQQNLNEQIIDHLFENRTGGAMDLAALNIQRSRDHGLPGYAAYRKVCNLSEPRNFDDLKSDISNAQVRDKLKELYGHPGNVDVWVGGIMEDQRKGAIVGPLLQCLITDQFKRLRDGDRFWYENPTTFTPSQLSAIKEVTLSRIFCDNGDNITTITKDVFILPSLQTSSYVSCDKIPKLDLKPWISSKV